MRVEKSQFLLKKEYYVPKIASKSASMHSFTAKKVPKYKSGNFLVELVKSAKEKLKILKSNGAEIKEALDDVYKKFPELNQNGEKIKK